MYKLKVIVASTRPTRKGHVIADWFLPIAKGHPEFEVEVLDLKEIDLPLMNEPQHPRLQNYQHEHTKKWSAVIDEADAYIFVTPEYNYGLPAPLKNALDYLYKEWNYKPASFISYGGIAGGARAIQMLKQVVTTQKMVPIFEGVTIPFYINHLNEVGSFEAPEKIEQSAHTMLKELAKWTKALKPMRQKEAVVNY